MMENNLKSDQNSTTILSINVTDAEAEIFELLKNVIKFYNLNIEIRIVGGWVRDKLLRQFEERKSDQ